jgi:hypothetical protein
MIGMKNEHVVMVVDNALAGMGEFADDVYERLGRARRIVPCLSQGDGFEEFRLLLFYEKYLQLVSRTRTQRNGGRTFSGS